MAKTKFPKLPKINIPTDDRRVLKQVADSPYELKKSEEIYKIGYARGMLKGGMEERAETLLKGKPKIDVGMARSALLTKKERAFMQKKKFFKWYKNGLWIMD